MLKTIWTTRLYYVFGALFLVWVFSLSLFYVPGVFRPNIDTARKLTSIVYIIAPVLRLVSLNNSRYMRYSYVNRRGKHLDVIGLVSEKKRKWLWSIYIHFSPIFQIEIILLAVENRLWNIWSDKTLRFDIIKYTHFIYILNGAIMFITNQALNDHIYS